MTPASPAVSPDKLLAKVGSWTLTIDQFNEKLESLKDIIPDYNINDLESKKAILEELVHQQLLAQEAEQSGLADNKEIKDAVEEFRRTLLIREIVSKLTEGVEVADVEIQDYYNQNKSAFSEPSEWHLREIAVPAQDEAREVLIELLKGADFAAMARTRSKAASTAKDGDLGFIKEFSSAQMENAVSTLDVGTISSIFKGADGFYYIVKLEEKRGGKPLDFAAIKDEIKNGLNVMKQQQKILSYINELKQKTTIEVNERLLSE